MVEINVEKNQQKIKKNSKISKNVYFFVKTKVDII